ncbi:hypothetical protein C1Y41_16875 [Pantoea sp. ICBG 1758]|jgi:hypothetical protein|nr:hypothetical protein C1Y41_16875 [Pantoea sp. ICBG 1758]
MAAEVSKPPFEAHTEQLAAAINVIAIHTFIIILSLSVTALTLNKPGTDYAICLEQMRQKDNSDVSFCS